MKVVYHGPFIDGVEIGPTGQWAEPGRPVEVPDNIGQSLLEQESNWKAYRSTDTSGTVDDVLKSVGDDPELATQALEAERNGKNRSSLIEALEKIANPEGA